MSVPLKAMETIMDECIISSYLVKYSLSEYQFAYQETESSVTALQAFVTKLPKSLEAKEIELAAFFDIEGAFATHHMIQWSRQWRSVASTKALFIGLQKCYQIEKYQRTLEAHNSV